MLENIVIGVYWLTWSFRPHYRPLADSLSNRSEIHEYLLGFKGSGGLELTNLPPLCADWLEILGPSTSSNLKALSRSVMGKVYDMS
jgi:hypothetical protein